METPRILIADDQVHVLEALNLLLKNEGFVPEAVNSPAAVIQAVQERKFDVLLLDLNYARDTTSGVEGLELLSQIRAVDDCLPVVLMTAWGTIDLAVEAMQNGGRDFVQKPWDNDRLLHSLRRQIEEGRTLGARKREADEAREIQRRLLGTDLPALSGCQIDAFWKPAREVGGDYFDAIRLSDRAAAFCIADVAGKGLPAALLMSNMQAVVRGLAHQVASPAAMCRRLNRVAIDNTRSGRFTTLFYGILDRDAGSIDYCNAGHVPPMLVRQDGGIERLSEGGAVLGVFPDAHYDEARIPMGAGDRLVLVTDGITEAANSADEEFGEDRLIQLLRDHRRLTPAAVQDKITQALTSFAGQGLQDDATLMIVSRTVGTRNERNC